MRHGKGTQGPSGLLPPQPRKGGAVGGPGSRACSGAIGIRGDVEALDQADGLNRTEKNARSLTAVGMTISMVR
jgi:hypothetical protein